MDSSRCPGCVNCRCERVERRQRAEAGRRASSCMPNRCSRSPQAPSPTSPGARNPPEPTGERQQLARPVRDLLGGKDLIGRSSELLSRPRPILLAGSILAEAAVELPVVPAIHIAVPVEIEVPEVTGLADARFE